METKEPVFGKLLYNEEVCELLIEFVADFDNLEGTQTLIVSLDQYFDRVAKIAKSLIEHKYASARSFCGIRDNFYNLSVEIRELRIDIKILISALYVASFVRNNSELEILKWHWGKYGFVDRKDELTPLQRHQKAIYDEFCKVESIVDSRLFTEFFRGYVTHLVFDMIELSLSRLDSTIVSFKNLNLFEHYCNEASRIKRNYHEELRKLKLYNQLMHEINAF